MDNWLFQPAQLEVLMHPERWQIITHGHQTRGPVPLYARQWYKKVPQLHAHREVLICLGGYDYYGLGEDIYPTAPGRIFFFDPMVRHQLGYSPQSKPQEHLWLSLLPDQYTASILNIQKGRPKIQSASSILFDSGDVGLRMTAQTLGSERNASLPPEIRHLRLLSAVAAMVAPLLERGFKPPPSTPTRLADLQRVMSSLMEHMRETGGRGDSLDSLARISGYSPFHFLRLFKGITGYTVHHYIDLCRLQKVQDLQAQNWTQTAMAAELGFSTPQSFSRWYRKMRQVQSGEIS